MISRASVASVDSGARGEGGLKRPLLFLDQMRNAEGPGRNLRHPDLAQLIEQRPVADLEPFCCLLPVPAIVLENLQDDLALEVLGRLLGDVLERDRLAEVDLGDDTVRGASGISSATSASSLPIST